MKMRSEGQGRQIVERHEEHSWEKREEREKEGLELLNLESDSRA